MIQVLKQCGNDLSRDNVMKQAANLKNFAAPLLDPGITINTSPDNFSPIRQLQLITFNGASWEPFGEDLARLKTEEGERLRPRAFPCARPLDERLVARWSQFRARLPLGREARKEKRKGGKKRLLDVHSLQSSAAAAACAASADFRPRETIRP